MNFIPWLTNLLTYLYESNFHSACNHLLGIVLRVGSAQKEFFNFVHTSNDYAYRIAQ